MQEVDHLVVTAHEGSITACRLRYLQFEGPVQVRGSPRRKHSGVPGVRAGTRTPSRLLMPARRFLLRSAELFDMADTDEVIRLRLLRAIRSIH